MADSSDHPTILVVHNDREFREVLIRKLQQTGHLTLEGKDAVEALGIAIHHSRRIHLLLADDTDDSRVMAAALQPYRPYMHAMYISSNPNLSSVLMEISTVLDSSTRVFQERESSQAKVGAALTAKLDEARRRFLETSRDFLEVTREVPSAIPCPDSITRIQRPAKVMRRAFDDYLKARKEVEDHIADAVSRTKSK